MQITVDILVVYGELPYCDENFPVFCTKLEIFFSNKAIYLLENHLKRINRGLIVKESVCFGFVIMSSHLAS